MKKEQSRPVHYFIALSQLLPEFYLISGPNCWYLRILKDTILILL